MRELATGADHVARTAADRGRQVHVVRAAGDLAGSIRQFASVLRLPAWFGENLDALVDALRDLPGPAMLVWARVGPLRRTDPVAYQGILDVLRQVDAERTDLDVVVVAG